jgi:ribosomal protein S18 acetylase RimI-like enzyme
VSLPAGFTSRPATHDDAHDIWELVVAVDVEEYGDPDYDESDVRDDFARDRLDLTRDSWLVHDASGALVACALAWDKEPHALVVADSAVHPDAPDLYPWLVARIGERAAEHARESGRAVAHLYNSEPNLRRAAAITGAGYELVRVFRRMEAPLPAAPPPRDAGVRQVTPEDLRAVWEVMQAAFAEHYDFVPMSWEAWHRAFVESESYRPDLWWLAARDGEVVGILIGQAHEEKGWVKTVGVLPSARGTGVASALLLTAFARFAELGYPKVGLGVDSDNTTGAMRVYERLGMTATRRYDLYEKVFTRT